MAVIGGTVRRRSVPQGRAVAARWLQEFDPRLLVAGVGDLPIYGSVLGKTVVRGVGPGGVGMQGNAGSTGGNVGYNVALSGRHLTVALSVTPGPYVASLPMLMETSTDANANAAQSPFFLLPYYDGSAASTSYWALVWYAFEGSARYHILRFAAPPAGVPISLVARADYNYGSAGVGRGVWINGAPYAYTATQNTILNPQNFSTTTAYVNSRGRASLWGNSLVHSVGLLNAEVPDSLCRDISGNAALLYESDRWLFFFDDAAGSGGTTGVGSATGTSAADAVSGSVASAAGSSVATAVSGSVAVAGGAGTATALSGAIGSATGAAVASAWSGSVGQATGAGVATATAGSIAQAAGTSTATAYSSAASVASASGTSTAAALSGSVGQSAGTSTAAGYSSAASIAQAAGTSAGLAIAGFIATSTAASTAIALSGAIGVATGSSVANGASLSGNAGVGNATGTSAANARSGSIGQSVASSIALGVALTLSVDGPRGGRQYRLRAAAGARPATGNTRLPTN